MIQQRVHGAIPNNVAATLRSLSHWTGVISIVTCITVCAVIFLVLPFTMTVGAGLNRYFTDSAGDWTLSDAAQSLFGATAGMALLPLLVLCTFSAATLILNWLYVTRCDPPVRNQFLSVVACFIALVPLIGLFWYLA